MRFIPFTKPTINRKDARLAYKSLRSGWITRGQSVKDFEEIIAMKSGKKKCVCTDSATAAMELALRYLGIGAGDEVITTPYTYTATADVIVNVGAKVVFADIRDDYMIDPDDVERKVTDKTKAIIGVDIAGYPCNYTALLNIANKFKNIYRPRTAEQHILGRIAIIGDLAHSFGTWWPLRSIDYVAYSFHAIKNLTTGEGGAVAFDNVEAYDKILDLSDHGQRRMKESKNLWEYDITVFGQNHIMTNQQAEIGMNQYNRLDEIMQDRRETCKLYESMIDKSLGIKVNGNPNKSTCHLMMVSLPPHVSRDDVARDMFEDWIRVNVHYKPLPLMSAYKEAGYTMDGLDNAMRLFKAELTLPLYNGMKKKEVEYVCKSLNKAVAKRNGVLL